MDDISTKKKFTEEIIGMSLTEAQKKADDGGWQLNAGDMVTCDMNERRIHVTTNTDGKVTSAY